MWSLYMEAFYDFLSSDREFVSLVGQPMALAKRIPGPAGRNRGRPLGSAALSFSGCIWYKDRALMYPCIYEFKYPNSWMNPCILR